MSNQQTLRNIISSIESTMDTYNSNIVSISPKARLPKEIKTYVQSAQEQILFHLKQALSIMQDTRRQITNRAREELSYVRHDAVYNELVDFVGNIQEPGSTADLDPKGWADAWLMIVELQDLLDEKSRQKEA